MRDITIVVTRKYIAENLVESFWEYSLQHLIGEVNIDFKKSFKVDVISE